jgi:hypothetical protein
MGVNGMGGKFVDTGEMDDRGLVLVDLLVPGRSDLLMSTFEWRKALKTGPGAVPCERDSLKVVEFCDTHFPSVLGAGFAL